MQETQEMSFIPGTVRSPEGEHRSRPQYFCLENPTDRGAWWATVRGVAQSQTQLKQLSTQACKLPINEGRRRDEARVAVSYVAQIQMRRRCELKIVEKWEQARALRLALHTECQGPLQLFSLLSFNQSDCFPQWVNWTEQFFDCTDNEKISFFQNDEMLTHQFPGKKKKAPTLILILSLRKSNI